MRMLPLMEELWNDNEEIEEKVSEENLNADNNSSSKGLTEKELNHIEWLKMKTQSLDTMKGKYNSQLQEYLRLAKQLKNSTQTDQAQNPLLIPEGIDNPVAEDHAEYEREKTIIPSKHKLSVFRKQQANRAKREKRAEALGTSISKRMRKLESDSYNLDTYINQEQPVSIEQEAAHNQILPVTVGEIQNKKRKTKLKRKTELERERRAGLTQLFEELDYWVELDEK